MPKKIRKGGFATIANPSTYTSVDIGARLRDTRKANKYSIKELANKLKTKEEVIQAWEDGLSLPADRFLDELVKLYGVSKNYLLGLEEN